MTSDQVAVLFIAGRHSFAGAMDHNRVRVLDGLNSASTEFLQVHDASVFRGLWDGPTEQFDTITVPKSSIDCVVLTEDRHEVPLQRKYCARREAFALRVRAVGTLRSPWQADDRSQFRTGHNAQQRSVPFLSHGDGHNLQRREQRANTFSKSRLREQDKSFAAANRRPRRPGLPIMKKKVERKGVEPSTSALRNAALSQLSYRPGVVGDLGNGPSRGNRQF